MATYSTHNRFSLTQLYLEDRKQRAHLKKISEMKRQSGIDNSEPFRLPNLHQSFLKHLSEKRQEIDKENQAKSQKLINIMATKNTQRPLPFYPTNQARRNQIINLSNTDTGYFQRIAQAKGKYNAQEWKKQYEQHKQHLRLRKDNKLFTPLDTGINRQRIVQINSLMNSSSKHTTPTSSSLNIFQKYNKN